MDVLNRLISEPDQVEKFRLFNQVAKDRARIYLAATDRLTIKNNRRAGRSMVVVFLVGGMLLWFSQATAHVVHDMLVFVDCHR